MTSLKSSTVKIGGCFEDAFIYMGNLFASTPNGEVLVANLSEALTRTSNSNEKLNLFLRNDHLREGIIAPLSALPVIPEENASDFFSPPLREINEFDAGWRPVLDLSRVAEDLTTLDMLAYYERLHIGSDLGVFSMNIVRTSNGRADLYDMRKRVDSNCLSLSPRGGSVAASCGEDGVLLAIDEPNLLKNREDEFAELRQVVDQPSMKVGWLGLHMVNYEAPSSPHGHKSSYEQVPVERVPKGGESDLDNQEETLPRYIITDIHEDESLLSGELAVTSSSKIEHQNNWHNTFFSWNREGCFELRRRGWEFGHLGAIEESFSGTSNRPISSSYHPAGVVIESMDQVVLHLNDEEMIITDNECLSVRTFPNSRWYKNLILTIDEDAISITSPYATQS